MKISRGEFLRKLGISIAGATLGGGIVKSLGETQPAAPVENKIIWASSGPGFGNRLAITFDDGPTPGVTERVLEELKKRNLRATFFMIGSRVNAAPDLAKRVFEEGHEVCNHSYTHPKLSALPEEKVREEIVRTQEAIEKATGHRPVWLRPPYGAFRNKEQGPIAEAEGLGIAYWSIDPRDWSQPGAQHITDTIISQARPGSIILCHDLHPQTADAVPGILDRLIERDYEFINVSGFLGQPYVA